MRKERWRMGRPDPVRIGIARIETASPAPAGIDVPGRIDSKDRYYKDRDSKDRESKPRSSRDRRSRYIYSKDRLIEIKIANLSP